MLEKVQLEALHRAHVAELQRSVLQGLSRNGFDALVLHSGTPLKRTETDDQYWALRPTPHFQHWLPLSEPGCLVIVREGRKPVLVRPAATSYWESPAPPESDHFWGAFEVVEQAGSARDHVPQGRVAFIGDDLRAARELGIAEANPEQLVKALDQLRVRKSPYEVVCLAEANRRAAAGHDELRRLFRDASASELQLHLAYLGATSQDDVETPYKNIVALGPHAATLHHVSYEKRAQPALSLLLDAGASFAGYGSDITRTWVKGSGAAATSFAQLVAGVEAFQQELCRSVRIGIPYESLHEEAHRHVARVLREVGIAQASEDELISGGVTRAFFPHGLGHSLGLQCHDVGCGLRKAKAENPFLRNTTDVATGQVFTIEPGIYFIPALLAPFRARNDLDWKLVDALAQFGGVRIEDDVEVLDTGIRNLTREVLREGGGPA